MSTTMTDKEARILVNLKAKRKEIARKEAEALQILFKKYGECETVIELEGEDKPFRRVKLVDIRKKINDGGVHYRQTAVTQYEANITELKNKPKT